MTVRQPAEILGLGVPLVRLVLTRRPRPPRGARGRPRLIRPERHGALWAQLSANPTGTAADMQRVAGVAGDLHVLDRHAERDLSPRLEADQGMLAAARVRQPQAGTFSKTWPKLTSAERSPGRL